MQIARLDNEVFFKKAFTDMIVFKAFVKDILGLEVDPEVIETEKAFQPRLGNINFKCDIFAEDIVGRAWRRLRLKSAPPFVGVFSDGL